MATRRKQRSLADFQALIGRRFHRLIVQEIVHRVDRPNREFQCLCDCGKTVFAKPLDIERGAVKSCGCLKNDKLSARMFKHGFSASPIYSTWRWMMKRCYDKTSKSYSDYGGRGITICEHWHIFHNFEVEMLPSYLNRLEIERIDNNGSYNKENCRWATRQEQVRNKRNTVLIEHEGLRLTAGEWAKRTGIHRRTIKRRLARGCTPAMALITG